MSCKQLTDLSPWHGVFHEQGLLLKARELGIAYLFYTTLMEFTVNPTPCAMDLK